MRFDTARAVSWADRFAFPRAAGSDGERQAAEIVAGELARIGLRVERVELEGSRLPALVEPWLGWPGVGLLATGLTAAAYLGAHWPVRLALAVAALLWLRLTAVEGFLRGAAWQRRVPTTNIIAWRPVEGEGEGDGESEPPMLRVVFHTALDTFDPVRELVPAWLATPVVSTLLTAQIFCNLTIHRRPLGLPGWYWAGLFFYFLLLPALAIKVVLLVRGVARPDARDNRTGLAVLLELARGWPPGTDRRIETRFVATGGRTLGRAGLRALLHSIAAEWPARPTLLVDWLAPGIGQGLALREQGTAALAATAAADLWIPHHVVHRAWLGRAHWPCGRHGPGYVGMIGDALATRRLPLRPRAAPPAVDAQALGRAAQLATEVALRWARRIDNSRQ